MAVKRKMTIERLKQAQESAYKLQELRDFLNPAYFKIIENGKQQTSIAIRIVSPNGNFLRDVFPNFPQIEQFMKEQESVLHNKIVKMALKLYDKELKKFEKL